MTDKLCESLGIHAISFEDKSKVIKQNIVATGNDETDDYVLARTTLRSIVEVGANSLTELLTVAKTSQKARDYEVAAGIMKTLGDLTKNMKDLHKKEATTGKISNIESESLGQNNQTVHIDKAVFVGTTAQLLHELKKKATTVEEIN